MILWYVETVIVILILALALGAGHAWGWWAGIGVAVAGLILNGVGAFLLFAHAMRGLH